MGTTDASRYKWSKNFLKVLTDTSQTYGFSSAEMSTITGIFESFEAAYFNCQSSRRCKEDTVEKNYFKAKLKAIQSSYVARLQVHPLMTDVMRITFGIPIHSKNKTKHPDPNDHVTFGIQMDIGAHKVICPYRITGSMRRGKGVNHGVEVRYAIRELTDIAPVDPEEFEHSEVNTASPWSYTFKAQLSGKRAYFMMRWENGTGGKGSWSSIQNAIIP
jgi:hypothetical protein